MEVVEGEEVVGVQEEEVQQEEEEYQEEEEEEVEGVVEVVGRDLVVWEADLTVRALAWSLGAGGLWELDQVGGEIPEVEGEGEEGGEGGEMATLSVVEP